MTWKGAGDCDRVEGGQHARALGRLAAPPGGDVGHLQLFAQDVFREYRQERRGRSRLEQSRPQRVGHGHVARHYRLDQAGNAEPLLRRTFDKGRGPDPEVAEALSRNYLGSFRQNEAGAVLDRWAGETP